MINSPLEVVLSFIEEMNDWEHRMYLVSRVESGGVLNHESDKALLPKSSAADFREKYYDVFNGYCTKRDRKYGGQPNSWSRHGQYIGASRESVVSINDISSNRVEVIIKGGQFPDNRFMFVLLKKGGEWKIDSAKSGDEDEWEVHYL